MRLYIFKPRPAPNPVSPVEGLTVGQYLALKSYFEQEGLSGMCNLYRAMIAANARANRAENELRRIRIEGEKW